MKILFVPGRSRNQTLTAEHRLGGRRGPVVRSAGTAPSAGVRRTAGHVGWARFGVVMVARHRDQVVAWIGDALTVKWIVCLHILDDDAYGDDELLDLIEAGVEPILADIAT